MFFQKNVFRIYDLSVMTSGCPWSACRCFQNNEYTSPLLQEKGECEISENTIGILKRLVLRRERFGKHLFGNVSIVTLLPIMIPPIKTIFSCPEF